MDRIKAVLMIFCRLNLGEYNFYSYWLLGIIDWKNALRQSSIRKFWFFFLKQGRWLVLLQLKENYADVLITLKPYSNCVFVWVNYSFPEPFHRFSKYKDFTK